MSERYWGIYSRHSGWWREGKTSSNYDADWTRVVFYPHPAIAQAHLAEIQRLFTDNEWQRQWQVREFIEADPNERL